MYECFNTANFWQKQLILTYKKLPIKAVLKIFTKLPQNFIFHKFRRDSPNTGIFLSTFIYGRFLTKIEFKFIVLF